MKYGHIEIDCCRPELYSDLYGLLSEYTNGNKVRMCVCVEVGVTDDGEVLFSPRIKYKNEGLSQEPCCRYGYK